MPTSKRAELDRYVIRVVRMIIGTSPPDPERQRLFRAALEKRLARQAREASTACGGRLSAAATDPTQPMAALEPSDMRFDIARALVGRLCRDPAQCATHACRRARQCWLISDLDRRKKEADREERGVDPGAGARDTVPSRCHDGHARRICVRDARGNRSYRGEASGEP